MPQPDNTNFSIDYPIYENIMNPISKKICFIHPNWITILGLLLIIPIAHNLLNDGNIYVFTLLGFIKIILDCFDGSIARNCNKSSKLGAFLDIFSDTLTVIFVGIIFIYKLYEKNNSGINKNLLISVVIIAIIYYIMQVVSEIRDRRNSKTIFKFKLDKYIHDNTIIIVPLVFYLIKKIIE